MTDQPSKTLNFFPYYQKFLESGEKTTTLRLSNKEMLQVGDKVAITVGWEPDDAKLLHEVIITSVQRKSVSDLTLDDLLGESPDCQTPESAQLVLGCVYRRVVSKNDQVWIVRFRKNREH
jgi:hypothetical protein